MNRPRRMQKRWSWIMGAITLVVALFFPRLWVPWRVAGFFWQLSEPSLLVDPLTRLIFIFPPCALTASMIWCWSQQMNRHPTAIRALVVVLEATMLALLVTAVFHTVISIIPVVGAAGSGWVIAAAIFNTMWAGIAFFVFLPCLLTAALVTASLQRKNQATEDDTRLER